MNGSDLLRISGLSVQASAIVSAAFTSSYADDIALISRALAGNDRFNGSRGG